MNDDLTRRGFLGVAGTSVAAGAVAGALAEGPAPALPDGPIKILGISTSPRKGKSTAVAVQACLDAAKAVDPARIEVELIDLGGLKIDGAPAAGIPLAPGEQDDFPALVPKLGDKRVAGMIIGSPVYFGNMTSLCKAFLERWMVFRKDNFALSNKVAGVLAVGAARNGGQEQTIRSIQTALFCQEMIVVGESRPSSHFGPGVWNKKEYNDDVSKDADGMATVKNLGRRVAEVALRLAAARA